MDVALFQPALHLVGGGDRCSARPTRMNCGFNPPSTSSVEGTAGIGSGWLAVLFQPALHLVGGGDCPAHLSAPASWRLQPALHLVGGGDATGSAPSAGTRCFNPPSTSSVEGTKREGAARVHGRVSTRPPPRRWRGRCGWWSCRNLRNRFNPPSTSSVEGTRGARPRGVGRVVSTRPPPRRWRGQALRDRAASITEFQPALHLVGGGDHATLYRHRTPEGFNPPSTSSVEGT